MIKNHHPEKTINMRSRNPYQYLIYINLLLFLILIMQIVFHLVLFPKVAVNTIHIHSDVQFDEADIWHMLGFQKAQNYYSIDTLEIYNRVKQNPIVKTVEVQKKFPNILHLSMITRKPILTILHKHKIPFSKVTSKKREAQIHNPTFQSIPILIDKEGVIFQVGLGQFQEVPILSGLEFNTKNLLNSRIPQALLPLLQNLEELKSRHPKLYSLLSEIHTKLQLTNIETDIYLKNTQFHIKTQGKVNAHILITSLIAKEILKRANETTRYLDMRTTGIVYRSSKYSNKHHRDRPLPMVP